MLRDLKNTKEVLNKFAKYVVSQSKANLTRGNKNYKKDLHKSIKSELTVSPNSFGLGFIMNEYGIYQDKGVSGTEKKYNTKFSYRDKMPPIQPIADWAKFRRIRLRNEKGQFAKGNYKTIGYLIARSIQRKGIKPSLFFTKPFEKAFQDLPEDLIEAFGLDLDMFIDLTLKDNR